MEPVIFETGERAAVLRPATARDLPAVRELLTGMHLPTAGVTEWWSRFVIAAEGERLVGLAGAESYDDGTLLRSVAVHPEWRGTGLGRALVERVLDREWAAGARHAYLLTTTAEHYFPRLGFAVIAREAVPPGVRASVEFREACPASAIVMHRPLAEHPDRGTPGR